MIEFVIVFGWENHYKRAVREFTLAGMDTQIFFQKSWLMGLFGGRWTYILIPEREEGEE